MDPVKLSGHHKVTADKIFAHPVSHNIEWHDVVSLLGHIGSVTEEANHRYMVTVGTESQTFDHPRGDDLDAQQVVDLRRMLHNAGFGPDQPS